MGEVEDIPEKDKEGGETNGGSSYSIFNFIFSGRLRNNASRSKPSEESEDVYWR